MLRSFLLALCLLVCLACATPLPIESLEEGMAAGTVYERFGVPEDIEPGLQGVKMSWTYVDENQFWPMFIFPQAILTIPVLAAIPDTPWDYFYVRRRQVLLHFEAEMLVGWSVGAFSWTPTPYYGDPFWMHEMMRHPGHIHGHGC
jgi:hypothetical protein